MRNKKKELSIIKNLKNLLFLISPFWKYGKIYLLGMLFFSVILTPIKSTISVLFTQTCTFVNDVRLKNKSQS